MATALELDPSDAVRLTRETYGADSIEALTTLDDVTFDVQSLIPGRPQD